MDHAIYNDIGNDNDENETRLWSYLASNLIPVKWKEAFSLWQQMTIRQIQPNITLNKAQAESPKKDKSRDRIH